MLHFIECATCPVKCETMWSRFNSDSDPKSLKRGRFRFQNRNCPISDRDVTWFRNPFINYGVDVERTNRQITVHSQKKYLSPLYIISIYHFQKAFRHIKENYTPVSLLSCVSKVMENVYHHLSQFSVDIQLNKLIKYREDSGVQMQLTQVIFCVLSWISPESAALRQWTPIISS